MNINHCIELLSPASNFKQMYYSYLYGADSVYVGLPNYSLRVKNNKFNYKSLKQAIIKAHKLKKKIYLTINIFAHNYKINNLLNIDLKKIINLKPDALIISDPGIIFLVLKITNKIPIHLSVQANCLNWATIKFWQKIGLKRIILPRELSLIEIKELRNKIPDIELEMFIHGSLCIAYSGKCLLSTYLEHRDANQGICSNICRRKFINKTYKKKKIIIEEDELGTYLLNSKDLCTIDIIHKLKEIGINSFKIEGRNKSIYYTIKTIFSYKKILNLNYLDCKKKYFYILKVLKDDLITKENYINPYINKFKVITKNINYNKLKLKTILVGEFTGEYKNKYAKIIVKNKINIGDKLEILTPTNNLCIILKKMVNDKFKKINIALGNPYIIWVYLNLNINLKFSMLIKYIIW